MSLSTTQSPDPERTAAVDLLETIRDGNHARLGQADIQRLVELGCIQQSTDTAHSTFTSFERDINEIIRKATTHQVTIADASKNYDAVEQSCSGPRHKIALAFGSDAAKERERKLEGYETILTDGVKTYEQLATELSKKLAAAPARTFRCLSTIYVVTPDGYKQVQENWSIPALPEDLVTFESEDTEDQGGDSASALDATDRESKRDRTLEKEEVEEPDQDQDEEPEQDRIEAEPFEIPADREEQLKVAADLLRGETAGLGKLLHLWNAADDLTSDGILARASNVSTPTSNRFLIELVTDTNLDSVFQLRAIRALAPRVAHPAVFQAFCDHIENVEYVATNYDAIYDAILKDSLAAQVFEQANDLFVNCQDYVFQGRLIEFTAKQSGERATETLCAFLDEENDEEIVEEVDELVVEALAARIDQPKARAKLLEFYPKIAGLRASKVVIDAIARTTEAESEDMVTLYENEGDDSLKDHILELMKDRGMVRGLISIMSDQEMSDATSHERLVAALCHGEITDERAEYLGAAFEVIQDVILQKDLIKFVASSTSPKRDELLSEFERNTTDDGLLELIAAAKKPASS